MKITSDDRKALAEAININEQYLYQCLTGRREASPELCVAIERESNGKVRRWALRPNDWHLIWPELIGAEGAPAIQAAEQS